MGTVQVHIRRTDSGTWLADVEARYSAHRVMIHDTERFLAQLYSITRSYVQRGYGVRYV
jgi:hypothetical protein